MLEEALRTLMVPGGPQEDPRGARRIANPRSGVMTS